MTLDVNLGEPFYSSLYIRVNKDLTFADLRHQVAASMNAVRVPQGYSLEDFEFRYANEPISLSTKICDGLRVPGLNRVDVVFSFKKVEVRESAQSRPQQDYDELTEEMLPYSSSGKYSILPPMQVLCRLKVSELQELKGLTVVSEHGEICFPEAFNALGFDVDKLVSIEHLNLEVTDKDLLADVYGFNKQVKFTIRGLPTNKPDSQMKTDLMRRLQLIDARITDWDAAGRAVTFVANSTSLY